MISKPASIDQRSSHKRHASLNSGVPILQRDITPAAVRTTPTPHEDAVDEDRLLSGDHIGFRPASPAAAAADP